MKRKPNPARLTSVLARRRARVKALQKTEPTRFVPFTIRNPYTGSMLEVVGFSVKNLVEPVYFKQSSVMLDRPDGYISRGSVVTLHTRHQGDVVIPWEDTVVAENKELIWKKGHNHG